MVTVLLGVSPLVLLITTLLIILKKIENKSQRDCSFFLGLICFDDDWRENHVGFLSRESHFLIKVSTDLKESLIARAAEVEKKLWRTPASLLVRSRSLTSGSYPAEF